MNGKRCSTCTAELSSWEGTRCLWHGLDGKDLRHLGNADAAICVVEQQPTPLSAYDISRIMEHDYGREIHRASLSTTLNSNQRFCWAGKGLFGLYRHRLFPGPRNLRGIGSLFLAAAATPMSLDALAFAMRWCGYNFADFLLLNAMRRQAPVAAQLTGADATDARQWMLSILNEGGMRRHLEVQGFAPKHEQIDSLIERCRNFIKDAEAERTRRLGDAATGELADLNTPGSDGNYAPSGTLTRANYDATLAAARERGRPWLDGSSKPIAHILRRGGVRWSDQAERKALIAGARRAIFGDRAVPSDDATDGIGGNEGSVKR